MLDTINRVHYGMSVFGVKAAIHRVQYLFRYFDSNFLGFIPVRFSALIFIFCFGISALLFMSVLQVVPNNWMATSTIERLPIFPLGHFRIFRNLGGHCLLNGGDIGRIDFIDFYYRVNCISYRR